MPLTIQPYRGYMIGSPDELGKSQLAGLTELFRQRPGRCSSALEGRSPITRGSVDAIGAVAVKAYSRGGLVQHLSRHHYLRRGKPRCQKEFEMLSTAGHCGVKVPAPIAFAYHGRMFYRGWLVTREVPGALNLAQLCLADQDRCRPALAALADQIRRLVENRVIHVDLHPGNVLVDQKDSVFIVDFDRARISNWPEDKLRRHYISRWDRAVAKHRLPSLLSEGLHYDLNSFPQKP